LQNAWHHGADFHRIKKFGKCPGKPKIVTGWLTMRPIPSKNVPKYGTKLMVISTPVATFPNSMKIRAVVPSILQTAVNKQLLIDDIRDLCTCGCISSADISSFSCSRANMPSDIEYRSIDSLLAVGRFTARSNQHHDVSAYADV